MADQSEIDIKITQIKGAAIALACCPNGLNSVTGQQQLTDLAALVAEVQTMTAP